MGSRVGPPGRPVAGPDGGAGIGRLLGNCVGRLHVLPRRVEVRRAPGVPAALIWTPACQPDRSRSRGREIDPPPSPSENPMSVGLRSDVPRRSRSRSSTGIWKRSNECPLCSILETAGALRHRPFFFRRSGGRTGREEAMRRRTEEKLQPRNEGVEPAGFLA